MSDELKACPFCKAHGEDVYPIPAESTHSDPPIHYRQIYCFQCDARGPKALNDADAANAWNTRPQADAEGVREALGEAVAWADDMAAKGNPPWQTWVVKARAALAAPTPPAKDELRERAVKLRDALWDNMTGRRGFRMDQRGVDDATEEEWRETWLGIIKAALQAPVPEGGSELRKFAESITSALGPYPDLNGHPIVGAARAALAAAPKEGKV